MSLSTTARLNISPAEGPPTLARWKSTANGAHGASTTSMPRTPWSRSLFLPSVICAMPGGSFLRRKSIVTSWPGFVFFNSAVNWSRLPTGVPSTASMASPACSLSTDGPGSMTEATVTAFGYFRYPRAAYSAAASERLKSAALSFSISSRDLPGG
ncbi:Uncharacterised protein [Mycobacterium tuberculosis]|uniref:Uncharacterized protein n=1 Tax=Mycobacterium tuberculosis TaxID=1773 RepID=A0A655IYN3_MYCTX|nr:Uncharacterised protein [Mycobacterium tuberculosis]CKT28740.1 Uncharacterised protein [Mycobacterium tuberculosis]COW24221.1 Uncharacterised protein [Mycobacterium tuberculosis]